MKKIFISIWKAIVSFFYKLFTLIFGKMSTTDPTSPKETVMEFPSSCLSMVKREDAPKLVVTDLGNNKLQFQIQGTPQITGVYKKFSFQRLRLETAEEKYDRIIKEDDPNYDKDQPDIHQFDREQIPYIEREAVKVRVIWYHRLNHDVEILSGRLNEPVIIQVGEETVCVRGRIYLVNTPNEFDGGDPAGDDPPVWSKGQ